MGTADEADKLAGSKVLMIYGEKTRKLWRSGLFSTGVMSGTRKPHERSRVRAYTYCNAISRLLQIALKVGW